MGVCPTNPHVFCGFGEGIRLCPSGRPVEGTPGVCRSLYDRSRSLVRIAGSKSDLFPVHVGLRQGCPLSPVLFIIFMDRISRRSQGPEGVGFGDHAISSLLFADDVVVLATSDQDLQHALGRFAAECEAVGMRISASRPRTRWRDYVSRLAWERLGVPPEELEDVSREREVWASLLRLLPPRPGPG